MKPNTLTTAFLLVLVAILAAIIINVKTTSMPENNTFDNVIKSQVIRASYLIYPPYFMKDNKTGKLSGIFHDLMMSIGRHADLDIEWTEEVGYENIFSGLNYNRYDVFAGGLWPDTTRAKSGLFTEPAFYSVIKAWGRYNETRFQHTLEHANNSSVRIATIDGALEDIITKSDYPKATQISLPQLSPFKQNLTHIITNKADITFAEPSIIREFKKTNPNSLKPLANGQAIRIFGNSLVVKKGEHDLKALLDAGIKQIIYSGEMDRILNKYNGTPEVFPRAALPYQEENHGRR